MRTGNLLTLIPGLMLAASGPAAEQSRLQVSEPSFAFEIFDPAQSVEHAFSFLNSGPEPMQLTEVPDSSSGFALKLATVEPGRRYRLELVMRSDAKPGRQTEEITLLTSSKKQPRLVIQANTLVRERVYTFPESIDLGLIRRSELKANAG